MRGAAVGDDKAKRLREARADARSQSVLAVEYGRVVLWTRVGGRDNANRRSAERGDSRSEVAAGRVRHWHSGCRWVGIVAGGNQLRSE